MKSSQELRDLAEEAVQQMIDDEAFVSDRSQPIPFRRLWWALEVIDGYSDRRGNATDRLINAWVQLASDTFDEMVDTGFHLPGHECIDHMRKLVEDAGRLPYSVAATPATEEDE